MSEKCSRLRIYLQIFMVTIRQIPTDTSLTASTNVISMQYPNTILNTKMTLPQLVGPIDVVSPEHSSGDRSHEFQIASSKNASIEFSKAEYARPTKAELAHCTTSSRSSKYAQSQKLSSLTSQKIPDISTAGLVGSFLLSAPVGTSRCLPVSVALLSVPGGALLVLSWCLLFGWRLFLSFVGSPPPAVCPLGALV